MEKVSRKGPVDLRKKTEKKLKSRTGRLSTLSVASIDELVHKLETYQIELEMQNEELRGARVKLEKTMQKNVDLYEFAPVGYFTLSEKGVIQSVNITGATMLGLEKRNVLTMPFSKFILKEDREAFFGHLREVFGTRVKQTVELRLMTSGEAELPVQLQSSFSEDEDDKAGLYLTAVIDMSERKRAEEELRERKERLRDIIFSIGDWVWEIDEKGVYTYSSSKGAELFGHVVGKTPFDFMPPDEAKRISAIFSEIAANRERIRDLENWNIRTDGERVCLLTNGVPILDKEGNLKGYRGVDKDITERKRVEEALRNSEARYRGVVETQSEMICRFLPDTTLLFVNEAYMRYYGRSREDLIGNKFLLHLPVELHEDTLRYFASFGPGSPILTSEREVVFRDGVRRWQEWTDHAFFDADGKVTGFQSVGRDITERKKAEESLRLSEAALKYTQKDLQRLAGRLIFAQEEEMRRLSRELHDDLTQRLAVLAIDAGKLELDLGKKPDACPQISQKISQMKDRLIEVSEYVHNISRQIHPTILDDLGLVRAIESECATFMRREDIEIVFSNEDVPMGMDNNIGLCLYRIVQESLNNVITHSRAKSCRIFLKCAGDNIFLNVTDDGIGFNPVEVRHKVGLGLSSMRERVRLVHGDFSIKSQTGKGTMIKVRVPLPGSGA